MDSQEQTEAQFPRWKTTQEILENKLNERHHHFMQTLAEIRSDVASNDLKRRHAAIEKAKNKGMPEVEPLVNVANTVKKELIFQLLVPVGQAWETETLALVPFSELQERLQDILPWYMAAEIAKAFEQIQEGLGHFKQYKKPNHFTIGAKLQNRKKIQKMEQVEEGLIRLYAVMGKAYSKLAEFSLQSQATELENVLQSLVRQQADNIRNVLRDRHPDWFLSEMPPIELNDCISVLDFQTPKLSESFFVLPNPVEVTKKNKKELAGTVQTRTLFKKSKTKLMYKTVEIQITKIPYANTIFHDWREEIERSQVQLWNIICQCLIEQLAQMNRKLLEKTEQQAIALTNLPIESDRDR
ncbi:hypothetical protein [Geitlerinema sp. PCC 9228]|uniref:hypothetical protein n=1 Tax=Geitlerinema sp. PCC 9228 TaxID=111611 RepID=UPI0008F9CBCA|nr:hypothetical protein [Geitlerinema sp. PCC 9228]